MADEESSFWTGKDPIPLLISCYIIRCTIFLIFVTTPVPSGVFAPSVALGALLGRLYAEILIHYFGFVVNNRMLAVGGAAAFAAGMTRTTSPVLILLELTGEMNFSMGIFFSVLFSYIVSSIYCMSIFDTILNIKKLPYLPVLYSSTWNKKTSAEIMSKCPSNPFLNISINLQPV